MNLHLTEFTICQNLNASTFQEHRSCTNFCLLELLSNEESFCNIKITEISNRNYANNRQKRPLRKRIKSVKRKLTI